jgi:hypothetical protein
MRIRFHRTRCHGDIGWQTEMVPNLWRLDDRIWACRYRAPHCELASSVEKMSKPCRRSRCDRLWCLDCRLSRRGIVTGLEAKSPVPRVTTQHCWQSPIATPGVRSVWRIRPGNGSCEISEDFPIRKQQLDLGRTRRQQLCVLHAAHPACLDGER